MSNFWPNLKKNMCKFKVQITRKTTLQKLNYKHEVQDFNQWIGFCFFVWQLFIAYKKIRKYAAGFEQFKILKSQTQ